ncbi:hypothetical protein K491DRAFT_763364 [Lophiostoma macrostomum CBS 122681]|uniref:Phenylacetaldoxime dehydratase n=1 Tax=Lophiostoma macrostomum CBS 122681 TaxID=1314788 RepID=A0A6A6SM00_9PLEO|nr:hypothetical protein K491DRAFT_763364 [Lophiostoma macrostomum CBS 122681]
MRVNKIAIPTAYSDHASVVKGLSGIVIEVVGFSLQVATSHRNVRERGMRFFGADRHLRVRHRQSHPSSRYWVTTASGIDSFASQDIAAVIGFTIGRSLRADAQDLGSQSRAACIPAASGRDCSSAAAVKHNKCLRLEADTLHNKRTFVPRSPVSHPASSSSPIYSDREFIPANKMLECAIPEHLRKERTFPVSTPPDYQPPFPAYCARFPTQMADLVMAIIGAQYSDPGRNDGAGIATIKRFVTDCPESVRPTFWEVASVVDKAKALNLCVVAYWPSVEAYKGWQEQSGFQKWWDELTPDDESPGWFQEVFSPTVDRFETVFSNNAAPEGAANMQEHISGEMLEHAYWGSMRDRLGVAQDDNLEGERLGASSTNGKDGDTSTRRVRVPGKKNLTVIRSGQDWSGTLPKERKLYLETMHPVMITGMNFLRDEGRTVGCYNMNVWDVVDPNNFEANLERTFGLGYFDDLSSLEHWSKSHQTHIDIFGGFLMYAKKLENNISLRLFHEILVLEPSQQFFEYIGCHSETGMLASLQKDGS